MGEEETACFHILVSSHTAPKDKNHILSPRSNHFTTATLAFQRPRTRSKREPSTVASERQRVPSRASSTRTPSLRVPLSRKASRSAERSAAASPDAAAAVVALGTKRKTRDFDEGDAASEGTNINVVVRCRGRNERETRDNSAVVVRTEGVKGKLVELSMGANALSNKTYSFDRVYSPVADQNMVFDDTVKPILDEVLAGYNCTIFAYGQTGTGKTYTMSGDMTETLGMLSDNAGIIPRVLNQLFNKLKLENTDSCIKCSFIELYNEELRDLLAVEENGRLKIYDDTSRKGHSSTIVQGMEEKFIKNASQGIKVLQEGSLKRQVAATKCNDLSSRSHTIFTITACVAKTNEDGGEELVCAGKLNLVDLAGSENIQRSGAENKRATEAGLINKSLLTLGRVINALVDHSEHIPYRESKLTRLLQDSLGGHTKTCIIATISPAKDNLEETISTLQYAFRAKNIRNMPQVNPLLNKGVFMSELGSENDRLKSELIATRQRNGVYLSNDAYEEMMAQSESRRIVMEELTAKMETFERNLQNKTQEMFCLTTSLMELRREHEVTTREHEATKSRLEDANGIIDKQQAVLTDTEAALEAQTRRREAHQETEEKLAETGQELIGKLKGAVQDIGGLHAKNKRKSHLESVNRAAWSASQAQVAEVTAMVERQLVEMRDEQLGHVERVSRRIKSFELEQFVGAKKQLVEQHGLSRADVDEVLDGVVSEAADKVAAEIASEMGHFSTKLHDSYGCLGEKFKGIVEHLVQDIGRQRREIDGLRQQVQTAKGKAKMQSTKLAAGLQESVNERCRMADNEHQKVAAVVGQLTQLLNAQNEARKATYYEQGAWQQRAAGEALAGVEASLMELEGGVEALDEGEGKLLQQVHKSRHEFDSGLREAWAAAREQSSALQQTTQQVQAERVRVVAEQAEQLDADMAMLGHCVAQARSEAAGQQAAQGQALEALAGRVEAALGGMAARFGGAFERARLLGDEPRLCYPLATLRSGIAAAGMQDYEPTGQTPARRLWTYPATLPRTLAPDDDAINNGDTKANNGDDTRTNNGDDDDTKANNVNNNNNDDDNSDDNDGQASSSSSSPPCPSLRQILVSHATTPTPTKARAAAPGLENMVPSTPRVFERGARRPKSPRLV
ncbi:hypothetical protein CDD81_6091 [Ophiocordyceps australis]|uniref:Kinesin motor domain-containing protein n=1 Tax=Ophiocordyceps australis TaxID=1399860 RepID=A0A2C5Y3N8_9HYPO|nr:hypothetical protein CDD81_6091 [Ophiocordyceps australis]